MLNIMALQHKPEMGPGFLWLSRDLWPPALPGRESHASHSVVLVLPDQELGLLPCAINPYCPTCLASIMVLALTGALRGATEESVMKGHL